MSRGIVVLLLIFGILIIFFSLNRQAVQSQGVTFLLGLVIGMLIGWWTGGWRTLRKLRREDIERADTTYAQRKGRYL